MIVIDGVDGVLAHAGQELGTSAWHKITQEAVDTFADVTDDHQWIHVDVERAAGSPFRGTIAHGFLTLALLPALHASVFEIRGITHGLNYGLNRVRFPAPTPVGSSVRATVTLAEVAELDGGAQASFGTVVHSDAGDKPVCVAEFLIRVYGPRSAS